MFEKPECPYDFNAKFGKKLIEFLDQKQHPEIKKTWCWKNFKIFAQLKEGVEDYFAEAITGDPAWASFFMWRDCGSEKLWAETVIEKAVCGNPSLSAYCMCVHGSERTWAETVIEKAGYGDPSWAAYRMWRDCGSERIWAESVIEKAVCGDPALAAYCMCVHGSRKIWAETVIEKAVCGDLSRAANWMCVDCQSKKSWTKIVLEKAAHLGLPCEADYDYRIS